MDNFLNPQKVLEEFELKSTMTAADFGCGSGGWVIPLARKLEDGVVYAIDILDEPLSFLEAKLEFDKIRNVKLIKANVEKKKGSTLPDSFVDLVLMTNLLFQCKHKKDVLLEGKRILKQGGMILIVDWIKDNPLTKEIEYVSFDEIKKIAKELDLKVQKEFEAGSYHKGLTLIK